MQTKLGEKLVSSESVWSPSYLYHPVPLFAQFFKPINLKSLFWFRWHALHPFQKRLPIPARPTIGEVILAVLAGVVIFGILSSHIANIAPAAIKIGSDDDSPNISNSSHHHKHKLHDRGSLKGSGNLGDIVLALTFSTACHNSIWSFLLGLPFERALIWHKLFAYSTIIVGGVHGYIAYKETVRFQETGSQQEEGT